MSGSSADFNRTTSAMQAVFEERAGMILPNSGYSAARRDSPDARRIARAAMVRACAVLVGEIEALDAAIARDPACL